MTSPTDDKLQTIAVIATAQAVTIGFTSTTYTAKNTGTHSVFYRQNDPAITFAGTAAVLTASPFFMAELKPGKLFFAHGETIAVVCATGLTSTLSVMPYMVGSDTVEELQIERHLEIEGVNGADILDWSKHVDLATLVSSVLHIPHNDHTTSIQIEKTGATVKTALMSRDDIAVDASGFEGPLQLSWAVRGTNWTGVDYIVLRIGTGASHYLEWKVDPEFFSTTTWVKLASSFIEATQTGTGLDMSDITYIALGVEMSSSGGTTAAAIQFDFVHFLSAPYATPGTAIVVDAGNVANTVRVQKMGVASNAPVATDAGASNSGTQREITANDSPDVALLGKMYPTAAITNVDGAAGSSDYAEITLAAGTIFVDVSLAGKCRLVARTADTTSVTGCIYQPNIVYRIPTPEAKLWAYGIDAAHAVYTTSYIRT